MTKLFKRRNSADNLYMMELEVDNDDDALFEQ